MVPIGHSDQSKKTFNSNANGSDSTQPSNTNSLVSEESIQKAASAVFSHSRTNQTIDQRDSKEVVPLYVPHFKRENFKPNGSSSQQTGYSGSSSNSNNASSSSSSSVFDHTRTKNFESQQNQAKENLNFPKFEEAMPCHHTIFSMIASHLTPDIFYKMTHDEVIKNVNTFADKKIFLPFSYWPSVLSKFTNNRYGTLSEALKVLDYVKKKYPNEVDNITLQETIALYSEMMWVFIDRDDPGVNLLDHEISLENLYRKCSATKTRTCLLKFYNKTGKIKKTLQCFNEWPPHMEKDSHAFRYYLRAYKFEAIRNESIKIRNENPKLMEDPTFFVDFLGNYFICNEHCYDASEINELEEFFEQYPQHKQIDKSRRELLSAYIDVKDIKKAEKCFHEWLENELTKQTLEIMIRFKAYTNLEEAILLFEKHIQPNGIFHESITIHDTQDIKINLHNIKSNRHGSESYIGDSDFLIVVKLLFLHHFLRQKKDVNKNINIEIISGKGIYKTRDFVLKLLTDTFGWLPKNFENQTKNQGSILISKPIRSLLGYKIPLRIDEKETPTFIFSKTFHSEKKDD